MLPTQPACPCVYKSDCVCVYARVSVFLCVCACACVCAHVRVCVRVCVRACVQMCALARKCACVQLPDVHKPVHVVKQPVASQQKGAGNNNVSMCEANVLGTATSMATLAEDESLLAYSAVYGFSGGPSCACGRLKLLIMHLFLLYYSPIHHEQQLVLGAK